MSKPTWRYRMAELIEGWPVILFLVAVITGFIWWQVKPSRSDLARWAQCRPLYELARTAADSQAVDLLYPVQRSRATSVPLNCGTLRRQQAQGSG